MDKSLKRRNFLKGTAAAAATLAATGLAGCAPSEKENLSQTGSEGTKAHVVESDQVIALNEGTWIPVRCQQNCNGHCSNRALVKDGVVIRQATDDVNEDSVGRPQQRSCPRGRSLRQQVYNVERLRYPMKRKSWQPGGGENAHGELRGKDDWERISWDEALDYVANEMTRVYRDYGPRSVVSIGSRWAPAMQLLKAAGGCVVDGEVESYGTWSFFPNQLGLNLVGDQPDLRAANDRTDLPNAEWIVFYGCNPVWAQTGFPNYYYKIAQEGGTQFVYVGPSRNATAASFNARWIPVRPSTDTAFLLSVMYEMMRLDEEEGDIIDWEFLDKYTVGFDLDHMPADAKLQECISEYVQGKYDGIPKTPEWATEICGTPVEDIRWYASLMRKQNKVMLLHSYAASRSNGAENLPQAFLTVGCMGGHIGKSGHSTGCLFNVDNADSGPRHVDSTGFDNKVDANPLAPHEMSEGPGFWNSMLEGKYLSTLEDAAVNNSYKDPHEAVEAEVDPRLMFAINHNFLQTRQDLNSGIRALRKVETVVSMEIKTSLTALFADILLPLPTHWEYNDDESFGPLCWPNILADGGGLRHRRDAVNAFMPAIKPLYEVREERWICREILKRMGKDPDEAFPYENKQQYFDYFLNMWHLDGETDEHHTLLSWTEEDEKKWGVSHEYQEGTLEFEEFLEKGSYVVERKEGDNLGFIGYKAFIEDPDNNPLPSQSGKFELYCQAKADSYNVMGLNPEPIKPYANYIRPIAGYEDSFEDWEGKKKGEFPLQLYTPHYLRRAHTCYDNISWLQEAWVNPVFLNAQDASERGIVDGDTVLIRSAYGKTLRHAQLLESIMPGCVALPHGPHSVLDETDPDDIIDRGGNEEILYGPVHSNYMHHVNNYNTLLVDVEKYDGDPIPMDYERLPFTSGTGESE